MALLLWLGLAGPAAAVEIDWVSVGDANNPCYREFTYYQCNGTVRVEYQISATEITNVQYAEFLNAKAADDPLELYSESMGSDGGIRRKGNPGRYYYVAKSGHKHKPVTFVTYYDCLRFANWLHNGQGDGDTETGSYTLLGGTPTPSNPWVHRTAWATIVIPSNNEWIKAGYYDPVTSDYDRYPGSPGYSSYCTKPNSKPYSYNCVPGGPGKLTNVGGYTATPSAYGTFDQGGNAEEWTEKLSVLNGVYRRLLRGGGYEDDPNSFKKEAPGRFYPADEADPQYRLAGIGFRVAMRVPGPDAHLLAMTSLLVLARLRRHRALRSRRADRP